MCLHDIYFTSYEPPVLPVIDFKCEIKYGSARLLVEMRRRVIASGENIADPILSTNSLFVQRFRDKRIFLRLGTLHVRRAHSNQLCQYDWKAMKMRYLYADHTPLILKDSLLFGRAVI